MRLPVTLALLLCVGCWSGLLAEPKGPELPARLVEQPPVIDGDLSDAVWATAFHVSGFIRDDVKKPATEDTELWICLDGRRLYAAFRCHDRSPATIQALQTKRNAGLDTDDWVVLMLDPEHAHYVDAAFQFFVNPRGTQSEVIPGGAASQVTWKGDWQAAARITDAGWEAEMAIPLSMLRYPPGQRTFGVFTQRYLQREKERSSWPFLGLDAQREPRLCADLIGLQLPRSRVPLVVMPYALSEYREGEDEPLVSGLDLKYTFPSGALGLLTVNPDFRTIEDEVLSADFTYTERYRSERRPFFTEGGEGVCFPHETVFYSRRIGDVDYGMKWFGVFGPRQAGVLALTSPDAGEVVGTRLTRENPHDSWTMGAISNSGGEGRPRGVAWHAGSRQEWLRPEGNWAYSLRLGGSDTAQSEGMQTYLRARLERPMGGWSYHLTYLNTPQGFQPPLGYVPERGVRSTEFEAERPTHSERGTIQRTSTGYWLSTGPAWDGYRNTLGLGQSLAWRNGRALSASLEAQRRAGLDDYAASAAYGWDSQDLYRQGEVQASAGRKAGGSYFYGSLRQGWKLSPQAYASLALEHLRMTSPLYPADDWQLVGNGGWDFSPERSAHCRLVGTGAGVNLALSYRQEVRRGADLFVILGDPNAEKTQERLAVKMVWPLLY